MTRTRALTEFGPLGAFFVTNLIFGIMPATAVLVGLTVVAVIYAWRVERRVPIMPLIGAIMVSAFGGLTLILDDTFFLKIKPSVVSLLFAAALGFGLLTGKNLLKVAFGEFIELDARGWRNLTIYWMCVFCVVAAANEIAWRSLSTDAWVTFKTFGLTGISVIAAIGAAPLMKAAQRTSED
ncbi:MAG: septation protein IspZ [Alphaproteobacteria bacterium]|nr:septation protein IspZ [Alphaproteobacteria bacterium]